MINYYGYRCYSEKGNALGWLYTARDDAELNYTLKNLQWCKRWKTERGAKKNFDWHNKRWNFKTGGYLKIELIPENLSNPYQSQQTWQENNSEIVQESKAKYDQLNPVWSVRIKAEIREWLESERWNNNSGEQETNVALINRKLEKLMKLEQQGF